MPAPLHTMARADRVLPANNQEEPKSPERACGRPMTCENCGLYEVPVRGGCSVSQSLLGLGPTHTVNSLRRECGHGKRGKCRLTARSHRLKKAARAEVNQARLAAKETGTRYHVQAASRGVYRGSQGELAKSQAYYPMRAHA